MPIVKTQLKESRAIRHDIEAEKIIAGQFKSNMTIVDIKEIKPTKDAPKDKSGIIFEYVFRTDYNLEEPKNKKLGNIEIIGQIIFVDDTSKINATLKEWKKNKKVETELLQQILNAAFEEAQIEALTQSRKVGLPPAIPLPRVTTTQQQPPTSVG